MTCKEEILHDRGELIKEMIGFLEGVLELGTHETEAYHAIVRAMEHRVALMASLEDIEEGGDGVY